MTNNNLCLVKILNPLCKKETLKMQEYTWELELKKQFEQKPYYMFIEEQTRKYFPFCEVFLDEINNKIIIELFWNV